MTTSILRRSSAARLAPALALLSVALGASSARAAAETGNNQRVVLRAFHGPQAGRVKDAIESALLLRYSLVPDSMVTEAARRSGGRLLTDQDFASVAKTLDVQAFVSATVRKQQDWRIEMVVRKGDTGQAVARYDWSGRRLDALAASVARNTPRRLRVLLAGKTDVEPPAADAVVQAHADAPRASASDGGGEPSTATSARDPALERPFLEISVGSRVFSRSMAFAQNVNGLAGYRLDRGAGLAADMALHPFGASAATAGTWAAGLGLYGTVNLSLGIGTQVDASGVPSKTDTYGYEMGVRYRITAGIFDVLPRGSYMVDSFVTSGDQSPNVHYQVLRAGVATRAALTARFSLRASLDYLHVLSAGALTSTTFPHASANGVDLAFGAGYEIGKTFEIQASAALRRYGFDMRSQPGDAVVAGGASDQYLSMVIGVAYRPSLGRH
jgi:hypothetical protein